MTNDVPACSKCKPRYHRNQQYLPVGEVQVYALLPCAWGTLPCTSSTLPLLATTENGNVPLVVLLLLLLLLFCRALPVLNFLFLSSF